MADPFTIDGVEIDFDNPCAIASALRKAELTIATGGGVVMTRFADHEVRWSETNLVRLREMIMDYERRCNAQNGRRVTTFYPTFSKGL